jgi:sugar lactone lactonase YvrE
LWSFDPLSGHINDHTVNARRIGSVALRESGDLLLACDDGLFRYDISTGERHFLVDPEPGRPGHRKNDGRTDWLGNFWIGTLREEDYGPVGAIYRIAPDLSITKFADGMAVPNGLVSDPDRKRLYFADTRAYTIWQCDYDGSLEKLDNHKVFAKTTAPARPDGSCIDSEGFVWNALYDGGKVVRYTPDGAIDRAIDLPVRYPTCCCFGGEKLDQLFITSAKEPLDEAERAAEPLAGRLLVVKPGVKGKPEFRTLI